METPLKGKTFVLIASAFEDIRLDVLEKPFLLTADYTGMHFVSFLVPDAGVSGGLETNAAMRQKAVMFGKQIGSYHVQ